MTFSVVLSSIVLMSLLIGSPSPASGQAVCNCSNTDSVPAFADEHRVSISGQRPGGLQLQQYGLNHVQQPRLSHHIGRLFH